MKISEMNWSKVEAYLKRDDASGTWLESHYRWQIRTFWWSLLWGVIGAVTALILVGFVAVNLILTHVIGPSKKTPVKQMPYESGMDPIGDARQPFDVRFYLVAILFLVFDVELLFLYPWAVASQNPEGIDAAVASGAVASRWLVFGEVMLFVALLAAGFVYAWRKGVFRWR